MVALYAALGLYSQTMPIRRHFIIVVDQTIKVNDDMMSLYKGLSAWLKGEDPSRYIDVAGSIVPQSVPFNPKEDAISLFAFGLIGDGLNMNGEYGRIHKLCEQEAPDSVVFNLIQQDLIHRRSRYTGGYKKEGVGGKVLASEGHITLSLDDAMSLDDYLSSEMLHLFNGTDPLHKLINDYSGVTMSHFVYPLITNFVPKDETSNEYYLLIVSDFKSGLYSNNDEDDWERFEEITAGKRPGNKKYRPYFERQLNVLRAPFIQADYLHFQRGGIGIRGTRLVHKGIVSKSQLYLGTNLSLSQAGGSKFNLSKAIITFDKDKFTTIDSIGVALYEGEDLLCYRTIVRGDDDAMKLLVRNSDREFEIPSQGSLDMGKSSLGNVTVNYIFFTMSHDTDGKPVLPVSLTASQNIDEDNIATINQQFRKNMALTIVLLIIIIGTVLSYIIRLQRGRKRHATLSYHIDRISKMRYMDIEDSKDAGLHVLDYDCWYIDEGDTETNIHCRGDVKLAPKFFAKKYPLRVSYMIKDLDQNYDFTFRPSGQDHTGMNRKEGVYYELSPDTNGHFEFDAVAYIDRDEEGNLKQPDYDGKDNILIMGLYIKVELVNSAGDVIELLDEKNNEQNPYTFIVKRNIRNRDLWMAFDPGTSGSCVAYGLGGTPDDMSNIHLAKNYERNRGWESPIIPSYIIVNDNNDTIKKVEKANNDKTPLHFIPADPDDQSKPYDFSFGNDAYQQVYHPNRFKSIKKLLGYNKTTQTIYGNQNNVKTEISGRDLAYLVVSGLIATFERFLRNNNEDDTKKVRPMFMQGNKFTPSRAIVAVPNNYTLTKVRDMVDSIRRTNKFKEVHYLYEAEGVVMSYLRQNWHDLGKKQKYTLVVFDMGGATINATAFKIKVNTDVTRSGNKYIRNVEVETVSKVGYGIGGDDIDFAIMQALYDIPQVKNAIRKGSINAEQNKINNKPFVLKFVEELKLAFIDYINSKNKKDALDSSNWFYSNENLWMAVSNAFKEWLSTKGRTVILEHKDTDGSSAIPYDFVDTVEALINKNVKKYVLSKVKDAVFELMNKTIANSQIELIFSGRSTLFPGIQETVLGEINSDKYGCKCADRWHGFDKESENVLDADKVKTAVVEGACWYAMWSGQIVMKHDIVTSTFGYIDMVNNAAKFIPVIKKNEAFESNGRKKATVPVQDPTLKNVRFIQMLGTNYDDILIKDIKYKKNEIVQVTGNEIDGVVEGVTIAVDDKNNFSYQVDIAGHKPLKGFYEAADTDIKDENSEAYIFAAIRTKPKVEEHLQSSAKTHRNTRGGGL